MSTTEPEVRGLRPYGFDWVVKFGGSLLATPDITRQAVAGVEAASASGFRLLIIPGGGPTDKSIEAIDREAPLARDTHHRACALAQDQTGLIICDSAFGRSLRPCDNLEEARNIARGGATPVLLPSRIMFAVDPFERSWEITSDAIAIWFAWLVGAPGAVILTDVDGILDPAAGAEGRLIRKILAS